MALLEWKGGIYRKTPAVSSESKLNKQFFLKFSKKGNRHVKFIEKYHNLYCN